MCIYNTDVIYGNGCKAATSGLQKGVVVRKQWPWASTGSLYTGGHPIQNVVLNLTMGGRHPINKFHRRWSQTSTSLCTPPAATGVK